MSAALGATTLVAGSALAGAIALAGSTPDRTGAGRRPSTEVALGRGTAAVPRLTLLGRRLAPALRLPADDETAQRLGRALAAAVLLAAVTPLALPTVLAGAWARTRLALLRSGAEHRRVVRAGLPDAVDLLALATTAGTGLALAHGEVARRLTGPVGTALLDADARASRGQARADALVAALTPLGDRAAALGHVLADHLRYGTPLGPELERLGLELRLDRRRAAEEEARRVPVRLLAPLVACTLPAFALLTVAPLLMASLRHLPT